ncbi:MAG: anti-sigma factor [Armatimonadota bacterium]|nr:anti-sigma factor [Armatimonadota bacterium]MDW8024422.1 anti-sigma factor [Armatimonadota bacterium]
MRRACAKARKYMSLMIDGEITMSARRWCEAHLRECIACRAEWNALQLIKRTMRAQASPVNIKAPVDVYECIAPRLAEIELSSMAGQSFRRKWLTLGFAFALTMLFGLCWLGIKVKQLMVQDVAYSEVSPIYVHAHILGAQEAQVLPNPTVSVSIIEAANLQ